MPVNVRHGSLGHWLLRLVQYAVVFGLILWVPTRASNGTIADFTTAYSLMIGAMALNLVIGYTGLISIGHSAFAGIGGYTTGILVTRYQWSVWWTFVAAFALAFVVGMVVSLPAMRIKGVYLALVTLSLALLFPQLMKWQKLEWLTEGSIGLKKAGFSTKMKSFEIFGWDPFGNIKVTDGKTVFHYWIAAVLVLITFAVCAGVIRSRVGRALVAIRDNSTSAAVMGINLAMTKALVFGLSAGLTALAGTFSAIRVGEVNPEVSTYTLLGAITFLMIMVVGGAGTLWGPVIGALAYTFLQTRTADWASDPQKIPAVLRPLLDWSKVPVATGVFAVALIVLMFVAPFGLVGAWKRATSRVIRVLPAPAGTVVPASVVASVIEDASDQPS
jgi:branched-chain amino acid transport system permease protein